MRSYLLFLFILNLFKKHSAISSEAHYECGPHGRFEYCIDDIPGCIIGCHCHPGYYFDTESKICEHNSRLSQDYRRHLFLEQTSSTTIRATSPTPTSINPIDEQVDAIAQDADDLGDWLYNQFFKTIKNGVINNTSQPLTRRSRRPAKPVFKRKSRRKSRKKKKRIGSALKKKGLKRKLLRITEDDSLFETSSEESESSDSDSSNSDSDTSESKSCDNDHGHRKIVMINKKSTPALPSFVFLPNIETPFYPPIGLPAPPVLPMYPMVPIGPIGPIFPGFTMNEINTTTVAPTNASTSSTEAVTKSTIQTTSTESVVSSTDPPSEDTEPPLRTDTKKERNKMMRLRNKMKKRNKKPPAQDMTPDFQNPNPFDPGSNQFKSQSVFDDMLPMDNVDFQYLSQLIHKNNLNKTDHNISKPKKSFLHNLNALITRKSYDTPNVNPAAAEYIQTPQLARQVSKADGESDSFYSNLGRQIASLIRKVDTKGEHRIDIQIQQNNAPPTNEMQSIFDANRYAPRSYWERFVRSPLKLKQILNENNYLMHSNEHLFNLENQANVVAAVEKFMSLQELENIANNIEKTDVLFPHRQRVSMKLRGYPTTNLNTNLNVHLFSDVKTDDSGSRLNINNGKNNNNIYAKRSRQNNVAKLDNSINNLAQVRNSTNASTKNTRAELTAKFYRLASKLPLHQQIPQIIHKDNTIQKPTSVQEMMRHQLNHNMVKYRSRNFIGHNDNSYNEQRAVIRMPIFAQNTEKPTDAKEHSYFHHELHHFDYFD